MAQKGTDHGTRRTRLWSYLPTDLLTLILNRLPWSSHPSFAAACRHWRSVVTPFFPAWLTPVLLSAAHVGSTNLRFYSPFYHKNFEVSRNLAAPGAKFCCSTGRHLTLCRMSNVLEVDLVTSQVQELPPIIYAWFQFVVYDGRSGTMFGVHMIGRPPQTSVAVKDDTGEWADWDYPAPLAAGTDLIESSPNTNPVLHGGLLYLLFNDGKLAVYDHDKHQEDGHFEFLDKPGSFGGLECEDAYLFESDEGKLMAVLAGRHGTPLNVVKLNETLMEWEKVESLGERALFTGTPTTMMRKTDVRWMQNKVFFPRLHDWPETVHVEIVDRDGEVAFVPTTSTGAADTSAAKDGRNMWAYELGSEESKEFWETEKLDYSIWVDFN